MEKDEIKIGHEYAYVELDERPLEPLRAVVLAEASGGSVRVTLYHPDSGQFEATVKTRELVGRWLDEPELDRFPAFKALTTRAHELGDQFTWASVAARRYGQTQRQRALVQRLIAVGIVRKPRHYAGQGGASGNVQDAQLQLNHDEIERLLLLAERGPSAAYVPPSPDLESTS